MAPRSIIVDNLGGMLSAGSASASSLLASAISAPVVELASETPSLNAEFSNAMGILAASAA